MVPKFTVVIGGSFGAGNYGMCGRAYDPRFLWMWPNARISVMGGEQAASVLVRGARSRAATTARTSRPASARSTTRRARPTTPPHASGTTAIIDPADTRRVLGMGLAATAHAPVPAPSYGVFRM